MASGAAESGESFSYLFLYAIPCRVTLRSCPHAMHHISCPIRLLRCPLVALCFLASFGGHRSLASGPADLAIVRLFDGRQSELLNSWGGAWGIGNVRGISIQTRTVHSGPGALAIDVGPTKATESRFFQCMASGFGSTPQYRQTRDMSRYKEIGFYVCNATHEWVDQEVVVDDNWVTSRQPSDIPAFNEAMLNLFARIATTASRQKMPEREASE
jgi:hypothetical protein